MWFSDFEFDAAGVVGLVIDWNVPAPGAVKKDPKELSHDMSLWKDFEDVLRQSLGLPGNQALALSPCV